MLESALGVGLSALGIGTTLANNAQQQRNFNEQMGFAKYQYEDMKKYNSMQAQVARMRAAGINPALAIGSGQLGTAATASSSPSAPSFNPLGVGEMMSGMSSMQDVAQQKRLVDAEASGKEIDNMSKGILNTLKIHDMLEDIRGKGFKNMRLEFENTPQRLLEMYNTNLNNIVADTAKKKAEANYQDAMATKIDMELPWLNQQQAAALNKIAMEVYTGYQNAVSNRISANAASSSASAQHEMAAAAKTSAAAAMRNAMKQNGIFFDENHKAEENAFIQSTLDQMEANTYIPETTTYGGGWHIGGKLFGIGGDNNYSSTQQNKVYNRYLEGHKRY